MKDSRVVRLLEPNRGDGPCAKSRGNWRLLVDDLCVCRVCDDPAITCYARLGDYGELPPFYTHALVTRNLPHAPVQTVAASSQQ